MCHYKYTCSLSIYFYVLIRSWELIRLSWQAQKKSSTPTRGALGLMRWADKQTNNGPHLPPGVLWACWDGLTSTKKKVLASHKHPTRVLLGCWSQFQEVLQPQHPRLPGAWVRTVFLSSYWFQVRFEVFFNISMWLNCPEFLQCNCFRLNRLLYWYLIYPFSTNIFLKINVVFVAWWISLLVLGKVCFSFWQFTTMTERVPPVEQYRITVFNQTDKI